MASGSDDVGFTRLGAELQRYQTLFWKERVLAVRVRLDKVFPDDDGFAPYDLPTLGGSTRLRGYKRGTYRGEGALLLAAEFAGRCGIPGTRRCSGKRGRCSMISATSRLTDSVRR